MSICTFLKKIFKTTQKSKKHLLNDTGMSLMEGKEDIFKELKEKFKSTYMVSDSPLIMIVCASSGLA